MRYTLFILNNLNLLFFMMTLIGTSISVSSTNWFTAWMGLELNMLSFVPLIVNNKSTVSSETAMKYFLIQASASSIFIMMCIYNSFYNFMYFFFDYPNMINTIILPLMMKLGAAPFHNWFINVMQGLDWTLCYLLMTLQKIAPLFLMNFLIKKPNIILLLSILSVMVGSIGALNQTSLNKILAFSSINHLGWMLSTNLINKNMLIMYLTFYMFMNLFVLQFLVNKKIYSFNQLNFNSNFIYWSISILSLGGMPPFIGFLPKWMIIQLLINNNFLLTSFIFISTALITLIFYIRLIISSMIFSPSIQKWSMMSFYKNKIFTLNNFMALFSSTALIFYNLLLT